jgi:hypothetical protein
MNVRFDHIEVHVKDIAKYCHFLQSLFEGGTYEVVSSSGTSMFNTPDGIKIEVKRKTIEDMPIMSGFCNPCLRRHNAKEFIKSLGLQIEKELSASFGMVYFFRDHEGVTWHIKNLQA